MQIKTSPFFASRLYPSITSCDNETNVKTHWGCTFFSYYSAAAAAVQVFKCIQLLLCSNHFILKAINCSHLISDPLKCLFLPPSHYFCLANSRHPAVSSTHFKICIDGLTRLHLSSRIFFGSLHASIDLCLWKSCQARYCLKIFFHGQSGKEARQFWWYKIRPKKFFSSSFFFALVNHSTLLNQIWNHFRIRAQKTLLNEEVIFAVRQQ